MQRKGQSERILQTLRGGLLKLDSQGRIALANPAFAEMAQCSQETLLGVDIRELLPSMVCDRLLAVPDESGFLDDFETSLRTRTGQHVPVSLRASALPDGAGGNELLVLLADLSRRKEVEAEVRKVDRLSALGRLSAGVAHEIRNPLAGIRTTAEILRGRLQTDDHRQFVDVILEETERLDRIVGSLLQFAKPPEPQTAELDVAALLQRTQQLAAGRAADRRITVRSRVGVDLPSPLADRDQILQVVLNLVLNAIDATPDGGEVRLDAAVDGSSVVIRVEDDGPGIAPSARERIFDPFFTTKPGGTGLGLSISRNILASHGGSLRIDGSGPGTCAVASLPIAGRVEGNRRH
jgi:two-component system sensor histidine kinase HydH